MASLINIDYGIWFSKKELASWNIFSCKFICTSRFINSIPKTNDFLLFEKR